MKAFKLRKYLKIYRTKNEFVFILDDTSYFNCILKIVRKQMSTSLPTTRYLSNNYLINLSEKSHVATLYYERK